MVERVDLTNYILLKVHAKKGAVITPPQPIRRPAAAAPPKPRLSPPEKIREFFGANVEVVP